VSYAYNAAGQKTSFTDGRGKVTTYSYNSDGLPSGITYPDSTGSTVTYNEDGQVATSTDGRGVVVTNSYNTGGQLVGVSYSDSTPSVSFAYNDDGAKTSMTDGTGTTTYSYDTGGRITTRTSPQGSVTFGYNIGNQLTAKTLAGSGLTTFGYDDAGRLTSVTSPSSENTTYSYDNANRKIGTVLGNGATETDSYNASGDLVDIWHKTAGGSTISRHEYTIDSAGRRVGESLNSGASSVSYTFDNGGQLTNEVRTGANAYTTSYSYDNAGNRTSKTLGGTTENYTYDDANKLLSAGGKTYSYDAAGNTTGVSSSSSTVSLTWDGAGRLKSATTSAGTYTYTSNGIGQRVAKSGPGVSQSYVLGSDAIDAPVLSDGAASYVYAGGLVSEVRGGTSKFYHSDALGTTRAITNGSGSTTDSLVTDAFGMTVAGSGSTPTPFGFAGQAGYQSDPETGLMRLGHRYYDNSTGHFISRDPICAGRNWYTYCENDPVNALDPSGLTSLALNPGSLTGIIGVGITVIGGIISAPVVIAVGAVVAVIGIFVGAAIAISHGGTVGPPDMGLNRGLSSSDYIFDEAHPEDQTPAPPPLGLGSTGRTTPETLEEELAMEEAISDPGGRPIAVPMTDPRWPGWEKWADNRHGIEIHYVKDPITGATDDFKFK
jgi:RHS repeat-associated protein